MSQIAKHPEIKDKIIASGIRVGTVVKTKFMIPFITQSTPEGFYLLDLDITPVSYTHLTLPTILLV